MAKFEKVIEIPIVIVKNGWPLLSALSAILFCDREPEYLINIWETCPPDPTHKHKQHPRIILLTSSLSAISILHHHFPLPLIPTSPTNTST